MTEPIEQRLLGLVEAAKQHARLDEDMDPCDGNPCSLRAPLAALSPATVSRLARVVEAARGFKDARTLLSIYEGPCQHKTQADHNSDTEGVLTSELALIRALAALDADAPEGGAGK